jgi:hypothetical protein
VRAYAAADYVLELEEVVELDAGRRADGCAGGAAGGTATDAPPGPRKTTSRGATAAEREAKWEATLRSLVKYYEEHGCMPPPDSEEGKWLDWQHTLFTHRGGMSEKRKAKVLLHGSYVAVVIMRGREAKYDWEANLAYQIEHHMKTGCLPDTVFATIWLEEQFKRVRVKRMSEEHAARLHALAVKSLGSMEGGYDSSAGWVAKNIMAKERLFTPSERANWPYQSQWLQDMTLDLLRDYHKEHGCMPPEGSEGDIFAKGLSDDVKYANASLFFPGMVAYYSYDRGYWRLRPRPDGQVKPLWMDRVAPSCQWTIRGGTEWASETARKWTREGPAQ